MPFYLVNPGQVRACREALWGALPCFILCTQLAGEKKKTASPPPVLTSGEKVTGHLLNEGRKQVPRALSRLFRVLEFSILLVNDYTHLWPRGIWGETDQNPHKIHTKLSDYECFC